MNRRPLTNIAHSVHDRLLAMARQSGRPYAEFLQYYAMERFLYRLSKTRHADRLLLKGALLLRIWNVPPARPTADIDLMGRMKFNGESLAEVVREAAAVTVEEDGLRFHTATIETSAITGEAEYHGWRLTFLATLGNSRIHMQLDVGLGDVVHPAPIVIEYPSMLGFPTPTLKACPPKTVVAEKLQAMVELEKANSRMKDFYDLWILSRHLEFKGDVLTRSIKATFERRATSLSSDAPMALTEEFSKDPVKITQWKAFIRRLPAATKGLSLEEVITALGIFLIPPLKAMNQDTGFEMVWLPGGPWRKKTAHKDTEGE